MGKYQLGEFKEVVMLTVSVLYGDTYGMSIKKEIERPSTEKSNCRSTSISIKTIERQELSFVKRRGVHK